jgi:hypothetical protein
VTCASRCRGGRAGRKPQRGFIDNESWIASSEHVLMYFNQPGVKMWWELCSGSFNPRFRKFLESSPPPKVATFVEIMRGSAVTQTSQ